MKQRSSSGFTIIETMLFLGVSGLLIIGALVGVGASLSNQRYRDSVETFKNLVQSQYSELGSVKNNRANNLRCGPDATPTDGSEYRGQSECLIVGRYMLVTEGDIKIFNVLAHETGSSSTSSDIEALRVNYAYNVDHSVVESRSMEWGTEVGWPTSGAELKTPQTPSSFALLFIRSPETGNVYTFSTNEVPSDADTINSGTFISMLVESDATPAEGRGERTICVVQPGAIAVGGDRSIYIAPRAVSANAVEIRTNQMGLTQC